MNPTPKAPYSRDAAIASPPFPLALLAERLKRARSATRTIQVRHPWIEAETSEAELAIRDFRALQYLKSLRR